MAHEASCEQARIKWATAMVEAANIPQADREWQIQSVGVECFRAGWEAGFEFAQDLATEDMEMHQ